MRHFPIFLDLAGRPVLVLGAGEAAARKAEALAACGAAVRRADRFAAPLLDGCVLAIGADAPDPELEALSAAAQARGIPVNIVDRPALCSFITPSVIDRDPITIAVGSGGAAPVLARLLRAKIEALVPPGYGTLAAFAGEVQARLRRILPDMARRRRVLEAAFTGAVAELVFAGRPREAEASLMALAEEAAPTGMVFLVGAGPGAADLLTLRAQRLLGEADLIVHDRLVSAEVLAMARRDAERIYVGKARANHCLKQEEINALLVRRARMGQRVVRLKGGDPFVFGRGGEEAEALEAAGVAFEVVPGITAALACAAQARIALTHRDVARGLIFVTGHSKDGRLALDFDHLAKFDGTIAVYMGLAALAQLRDGLHAAGLPASTRAALIESGGQPGQRALFGSLDMLVAQAPGWGGQGPTLLLIGEAVRPSTPPDQVLQARKGTLQSVGGRVSGLTVHVEGDRNVRTAGYPGLAD